MLPLVNVCLLSAFCFRRLRSTWKGCLISNLCTCLRWRVIFLGGHLRFPQCEKSISQINLWSWLSITAVNVSHLKNSHYSETKYLKKFYGTPWICHSIIDDDSNVKYKGLISDQAIFIWLDQKPWFLWVLWVLLW